MHTRKTTSSIENIASTSKRMSSTNKLNDQLNASYNQHMDSRHEEEIFEMKNTFSEADSSSVHVSFEMK